MDTYTNTEDAKMHTGRSGYTTAAGAAGSMPAVMAQYNDLQQSLNFLAEVVDNFRVRLEGVLGPMHTDGGPNKETSPPDAALSPLAESVRGDRRRVDGLRFQLQELLDRIEI